MNKLLYPFAFFLVVALVSTASVAASAPLYASKCKMCHGADGKGTAMGPALAGTDFIKGEAGAVKGAIKNGVSGADKRYPRFRMSMPKFKLTDAELDALVKHLKAL